MKPFILSLIFLAMPAWAYGAVTTFSHFQQIPVMDNGRLKPLDTFARTLLTQFSGRDHYDHQSAAAWIAKLFFDTASTRNDRIFLINDPDIAQALGIPPRQDRRYSPQQLEAGLPLLGKLDDAAEKIPDKDRSTTENEIIRIFNDVAFYRAFPAEVTVIPLSTTGQWLSPLDALPEMSNPHIRRLLVLWGKMAVAYKEGNNAAFDQAAADYGRAIRYALSKDDLRKLDRFPLEIFYQAAGPFTWSMMFYILAFVFFMVSLSSSKPLWYNLGLLSIMAGVIPHFLGLLMRIIIMARPPVSSLYETFLFVGLVAVILGLLIEYYNRQWLGIITAAISGTVLLLIAYKYSAEGDTLKVLVAVLNSNFWLATHVTTITMGYAATCVAGILGHIWLLQAAFRQDKDILEKTHKTTLGILGLALTLTFLGTNLGGIWADQSWGRFWGWDPKENGALMIVLWTALLFHAKAGQMIGPHGLAIGAVIGMMVVMWAWFGVNLLSIGLHSYGFTSGIAASLIVYAIVEVAFLSIAAMVVRS